MRRHRLPPTRRRQAQRGGIALLFALMLLPLMGFVGLALDMGRIYVNKTELQSAADACALSAAMHLRDTPPTNAAFTGAANSGQWIAGLNRFDLQSTAIGAGEVTVEFGPSLAGANWQTAGAGPAGGATFVRCTLQSSNFATWFLPLVGGTGTFTISARAIATVPAAASTNCGFTAGNCGQAPSLVF